MQRRETNGQPRARSDRMPEHMGSCIHSTVKKKRQKGTVSKHEHVANVYALLLSFINSSLFSYQYNCWGSPNPLLTIQSWHNPLVNCNWCIFCWKDYSTWQSKATVLQLATSALCSPHPSVMERTLRAPATTIIIHKQETNKWLVVSQNEKRALHYMNICNMYVKIDNTGQGEKWLHRRMNSQNITEKVQHYFGNQFPK